MSKNTPEDDNDLERVSIEHKLVELLQETINLWVNKSSYEGNRQKFAEMCADDIQDLNMLNKLPTSIVVVAAMISLPIAIFIQIL